MQSIWLSLSSSIYSDSFKRVSFIDALTMKESWHIPPFICEPTQGWNQSILYLGLSQANLRPEQNLFGTVNQEGKSST